MGDEAGVTVFRREEKMRKLEEKEVNLEYIRSVDRKYRRLW